MVNPSTIPVWKDPDTFILFLWGVIINVPIFLMYISKRGSNFSIVPGVKFPIFISFEVPESLGDIITTRRIHVW